MQLYSNHDTTNRKAPLAFDSSFAERAEKEKITFDTSVGWDATPSKEKLFISPAFEYNMAVCQKVIFAVSCCLHFPSMYCLLRETPPHQAQIKPILIFFQITVVVVDVFDMVLFEPVPLAESFEGLLCHVARPSMVLGLFFDGISALGIAILACILVRHQVMMPESHCLKLGKITIFAIIFTAAMLFLVPSTTFALYPFSKEDAELLIDQNRYDIAWMRERGVHFAVPDTPFVRVIFTAAITCLLLSIATGLAPFWHMHRVLTNETTRSERSKLIIRDSLRRLFAQLIIPFVFVTTPFVLIVFQALTRCLPFLVAVLAVVALNLHPIVHNLVLLLVMPTYRRAVSKALARLRSRTEPRKVSHISLTIRS